MNRFGVVSYPRFDQADRDWIEAIRAKHDPQAGKISAHFTFVFPVEISLAAVSGEVAAVVERSTPISFALRGALACPDILAEGGHVFLVPDEGRTEIARLHDRLYAGALRRYLREDIPFVPHVTVAANRDIRSCDALAQELNRTTRTVTGVIHVIDVIELTPSAIVSRARFGMGRPGSGFDPQAD